MNSLKNESWRRTTVAITGVNARAESPGPGLAVSRCLKNIPGYTGKIIGLGYDMLDAGLYARDSIDAGYLIPYPSSGEEALLERIKEIHSKENLEAIIPCLDAEILSFINIQDRLAKLGIATILPSHDQFNKRSKKNLQALCTQAKVLIPDGKTITCPSFFDTCLNEGFNYPLVVKGTFYDAVIVHDEFEAKAAFYRMIQSWGYPVIVQKFIEGDEYDLAGIGDGKGNLIASVTMRKRGLTDKGKAWAGVTVIDPQIKEFSEKIIKTLRWRGPFEIECMRNKDGNIYLIEINPRFPAWIYLSYGCKRNLPGILLKQLRGVNFSNDLEPEQAGIYFIRYAQELILDLIEFETMLTTGSLSSCNKSFTHNSRANTHIA